MQSFRFVIPIKLEDLTQASGQFDVYSVRLTYNLRDIPTKLNGISHETHFNSILIVLFLIKECSDNYQRNGIKFILEDFDAFFYCLK